MVDKGGEGVSFVPARNGTRPVTKGEVLAMTLAKAAGIRAAEARLVESDGLPAPLSLSPRHTGVPANGYRFGEERGGRWRGIFGVPEAALVGGSFKFFKIALSQQQNWGRKGVMGRPAP